MTNETVQQFDAKEQKQTLPFGAKLKAARETLGLDRKDVASQLRLSEKVILMMEKDRYPSDLPVTFIRGYLRAYAKYLQIPDYEIKKAVDPIKPKAHTPDSPHLLQPLPVNSKNYFMQFFTYIIFITMVGLVGSWWYTHAFTMSYPPVIAMNEAKTPETATTEADTLTTHAKTNFNSIATPNNIVAAMIEKQSQAENADDNQTLAEKNKIGPNEPSKIKPSIDANA